MSLSKNAQAMVAKGKGILAMDESFPTIEKRLKSIGSESTEENRWKYRRLLVTTKGLGEYISGAILFDETLRQKDKDSTTFVQHLQNQGIIPGIKVDKGAKELALYEGEKITEGLDGLRERLAEYYQLGARFAKWRAVVIIGDEIPTDWSLLANAHALARYAALCQEAGLVPIVEPEILMNGTHTIERCYKVTHQALQVLFDQLKQHKVDLTGIVLKPNMILPGEDCPTQVDADEIAKQTIQCFKETVPDSVPGCAFLSGGQSDKQAADNLRAMNTNFKDLPWNLTFSYGRALQREALKTWSGKEENIPAAQEALLKKAKTYGMATLGE